MANLVAGVADEEFTSQLETGDNTIDFTQTASKYFGHDTVTVSAGKNVNLVLPENYSAEIKGDDVVITTKSDYRYIVKAKVEGLTEGANPTLDGRDVPTDLIDENGYMTFYMSLTTMVGTPNSDIGVPDFVFASDKIYTSGDTDVKVFLSNANFTATEPVEFSGMKISDLHVYKIAQDYETVTIIEEITDSYKAAVEGATDYSYNKELFVPALGSDPTNPDAVVTKDQIESTITLKDFAKENPEAVVTINTDDNLAEHVFDVTMDSENYAGTWLKENIIGTANADVISSGAGNDMLTGGENGDTFVFSVGDGNDIINDATSADKIQFVDADLNDLKFAKSSNDLVITYGDTETPDTVTVKGFFAEGADKVNKFVTQDGEYTLNFEERHSNVTDTDLIFNVIEGASVGTTATDWIDAGSANDTVYGGASGKDMIAGNQGDDTLYAGALTEDGVVYNKDNVEMYGGEGADTIYGGEGNDWLMGDSDMNTTVDGDKTHITDGGNDEIHGGKGNDTILGGYYKTGAIGSGDDKLYGDEGEDSIYGGDGDDLLVGGKDNDKLYGGAGNDTFVFSVGDGNDIINDATSADKIQFVDADLNDLKFAKSSNDLVITYGDTETPDTVTVKGFFAEGADKVNKFVTQDGEYTLNFEERHSNVTDTDLIFNVIEGESVGTSATDWIDAGSANDTVYGGVSGKDMIAGNQGDDTLYAGAKVGKSVVYNKDDVEMYGGEGADTIYGGEGNDWLMGDSDMNTTVDGDKTHITDGGNDEIHGGKGNDTILGGYYKTGAIGSGDDKLYGDEGEDSIYGGDGDDLLVGGKDNDKLYGGAGNDTFQFAKGDGDDTIFDAKSDDTIKFTNVKSTELKFEADGANLVIKSNNDSVTIKDYFVLNGDKYEVNANVIDKIVTSDKKSYSIKNDAHISAVAANYSSNVTDGVTFTEYQEAAGAQSADLTATKGRNSWMEGDNRDNTIKGVDGYNMLAGNDGDDTIIGGSGFNEIYGGEGADTITGGNKGNYIWGDGLLDNGEMMGTADTNADTITGGKGDDTIFGGTWRDYFNKEGSGDDTINAVAGKNTIYGGDGNDVITGGSGADTFAYTLYKSFGDDTIKKANNNDRLYLRGADAASEAINKINALDKTALQSFDRVGDNLKVTTANGTITLENFFKNASSKNLDTISLSKDLSYSILKDATIKVSANEDGFYKGTDYNETIDVNAGDEVNLTMGKGTNIVNVTNGTAAKEQIINVTKGEKLYINVDGEHTYYVDGKDLIIFTVDDENNPSSIINLKNAAAKDTGAAIFVGKGDISNPDNYINIDLVPVLKYGDMDVNSKGKLTGSAVSDDIDLRDYISVNGKGVTVDSKSGSDKIQGSMYNDVIKASSLSGEKAEVVENAGTNKITTGKGDDTVLAGGYSSNTINVGAGENVVSLTSAGKNKVTAGNDVNHIMADNGSNNIKLGNGANTVALDGGVNTVKTGKGANTVSLTDGLNKVTTGKGQDTFYVEGGNNNISSGVGADKYFIAGGQNKIKTGNAASEFNIASAFDIDNDGTSDLFGNGGYNNITSGSKADKFNVSAGQNFIKSGAGNDEITISGGINVVNAGKGNDKFVVTGGTNALDGGAGNDSYTVDMKTFNFDDNSIVITDKSGANSLNLTVDKNGENLDNVNIFFDVEVVKGKNGKVSAKYGSLIFTDNDLALTAGLDDFSDVDGIAVMNKKGISTVNLTDGAEENATTASFGLSYKNIDKLASEVASWLNGKEYASTADVFANEKTDGDIAYLVSMYTNFADNGYKLV